MCVCVCVRDAVIEICAAAAADDELKQRARLSRARIMVDETLQATWGLFQIEESCRTQLPAESAARSNW